MIALINHWHLLHSCILSEMWVAVDYRSEVKSLVPISQHIGN